MIKWVLEFLLGVSFAMIMTYVFHRTRYHDLFANKIKSIIITLTVAMLVGVVTEWVIQTGALPFGEQIIFMFVAYFGAFIWWLLLRVVRG